MEMIESVDEKMGRLNGLGLFMAYELEDVEFSEDVDRRIWIIADGLFEKWYNRLRNSECSLKESLEWTPERVEENIVEEYKLLYSQLSEEQRELFKEMGGIEAI